MDETKEEHGTDVIVSPVRTGDKSAPDDLRVRSVPAIGASYQLAVADVIRLVSAAILCFGIANATVLFVYLCFTKPDAANVVVPLVLVPVLNWLANQWKEKKPEKKDEAE